MDYLLDTHTLIWILENNPKVPKQIREIIGNYDNNIYYSVASVWEVAIKHKKHPDQMLFSGKDLIFCLEHAGFDCALLGFKEMHFLEKVLNEDIHGDLFDHAILATAEANEMILITHDSILNNYEYKGIISY